MLILQSLAPAMLYTPTPMLNYSLVADKVMMPANGGSTIRFMRPKALKPPTIQLGNGGIDKNVCVDLKPVIIDLEFLAA